MSKFLKWNIRIPPIKWGSMMTTTMNFKSQTKAQLAIWSKLTKTNPEKRYIFIANLFYKTPYYYCRALLKGMLI